MGNIIKPKPVTTIVKSSLLNRLKHGNTSPDVVVHVSSAHDHNIDKWINKRNNPPPPLPFTYHMHINDGSGDIMETHKTVLEFHSQWSHRVAVYSNTKRLKLAC